MAERSRGMGRGLAAILSTAPGEGEPELRELPVELIAPNPQPAAPAASTRRRSSRWPTRSRDRGVLQPVLVRPLPGGTYELIAGERRWRAAQLAGLETVPAMIRPDDDAASLELALIENMAREDLNPLEEARAVAALVEELGLTREEVGRRVGRSRVAVSNLHPPARAARRGAGADRGRHAHRGPRSRAADGARPRRRGAGSRATPARRAGRSGRPRRAPARPPAARRPRSRRVAARARLHPDQVEAAERLGEAFGRALGADVRVTPRANGYRVQFAFESLDEALEVAERLGVTATA